MIGSVFSPYYALARRRGPADPFNHCVFNVVLYGRSAHRWAMTERTRHDTVRDSHNLRIGPSSVQWDGEAIRYAIDERCCPIPGRLKGHVRVTPTALTQNLTSLDAAGRHSWLPIAPHARVEINFQMPDLRWQGEGYFDCNFGQEPLERTFREWNWSRAHAGDGTTIFYDVERRDGSRFVLARRYVHDGSVQQLLPPPEAQLPSTLWRVSRQTRCDPNARPRLIKTLEDAPFYSRSLVQTSIDNRPLTMMHESLSLDRFARPVVQAMLPFRMPRRRFRKTD